MELTLFSLEEAIFYDLGLRQARTLGKLTSLTVAIWMVNDFFKRIVVYVAVVRTPGETAKCVHIPFK